MAPALAVIAGLVRIATNMFSSPFVWAMNVLLLLAGASAHRIVPAAQEALSAIQGLESAEDSYVNNHNENALSIVGSETSTSLGVCSIPLNIFSSVQSSAI